MKRDLTESEYLRFRDEILRLSGVEFGATKRALLSNRIRRRVRATGAADYDAYLGLLRTPSGRQEVQRFLDTITTTETWLFRGPSQWEFVRGWIRHWADHQSEPATLRIWSAATANGAEAYSAAICAREALGPGFGGHAIDVLGTDINVEALASARRACFGHYAVAQMDSALRNRWFRAAGGEFALDDELTAHVRFHRHNLLQPATEGPFDLVLLRNVLMHLARPARQLALDHAISALRPGGYLLTGEGEGLFGLDHPLDYGGPCRFRRPEPVPALA